MKAFRGWKDTPEKVFDAPLKGGSVACEVTPELLGVGYVIGPRIAAVMAAGGILSYLLLIPLIKFFGDGLSEPLMPGSTLIKDMSTRFGAPMCSISGRARWPLAESSASSAHCRSFGEGSGAGGAD
jgi:hypothetical protein